MRMFVHTHTRYKTVRTDNGNVQLNQKGEQQQLLLFMAVTKDAKEIFYKKNVRRQF
jgi:hypothetical protein